MHCSLWLWLEYYVYPVITRVKRLGGKATSAVLIDPIATLLTIGQSSERCVRIRRTEVLFVSGIMPQWRTIRHHIRRIGRDGDRCREVHLLPARGGFIAKGRAGQQRPTARPEFPGVRARIACPFVKTDPGNGAIDCSLKLDS